MTLARWRQIADFEIISCLGYGARSTIYAVSEKATKQVYALKRVIRKSADDDRFLEQAEQEFAIASQFDHAALRKSIRIIRKRKLLKTMELFLLMEFVDGISLDSQRPSKLTHLIKVFIQAAQGLTAMHRLGFVHADIKPNNFLVNDDLERVVQAELGEQRFVLAGHSMGAHTAVGYALRHPQRLAGLVVIGPVYTGDISPQSLVYWDGLASALEEGGIDGFVDYISAHQGIDTDWRDTVLRFTRARMELHRHPQALVQALREVPRSRPFGALSELEGLEVPALVVASHDAADPGHPYGTAVAYAEALPQGRLVSEGEGESPLAWQGGKLSREIAAFCDEPAVAAF